MAGYWKDQEKTEKTIDKGGWVHTGDMGYIDGDGYFYLAGRATDMIIRGGENISPEEVEAVLHTHPKVEEAAVFGVLDAEWGEVPMCVCVPKKGETCTPEELMEHCRANPEEVIASFSDAEGGGGGPTPGEVMGVQAPLLGIIDPDEWGLPLLTVVVAGLDAFNPCAFFVLLFLLSLMVHARSRSRMLLVGGTFVLISGLIYFIFMAAWLNVFLILGELRVVTIVAGLIAVVLATINIREYFLFGEGGPSLSIPESKKPGMYRRMRNLVGTQNIWAMLAGTVILAIAVNSYELLCTAGLPMVYTRILTLRETDTFVYYLYLLLYNVIYIIPLLIIVLLFVMKLGSRKLGETEGRLLKLMSGMMMLALGLLLLIAPTALNNPGIAIGLLIGAVGLTWVIHTLSRRAGLI